MAALSVPPGLLVTYTLVMSCSIMHADVGIQEYNTLGFCWTIHSQTKSDIVSRANRFRIVHRNLNLPTVEGRREVCKINASASEVQGRGDVFVALDPFDVARSNGMGVGIQCPGEGECYDGLVEWHREYGWKEEREKKSKELRENRTR